MSVTHAVGAAGPAGAGCRMSVAVYLTVYRNDCILGIQQARIVPRPIQVYTGIHRYTQVYIAVFVYRNTSGYSIQQYRPPLCASGPRAEPDWWVGPFPCL